MTKVKEIVVMPEFESSGIWRKSKKSICGLMIEYSELNLSKELIDSFENWIFEYDRIFFNYAAGIKKTLDKNKVNQINKTGKNLAKKLKKLFPKKSIWYSGENSKGSIIEPIEIK